MVALGNPERPVGGLAVRTPPGVELRPLAREDLPVALVFARELYGLPPADPGAHRSAFDGLVGDPDGAPFLALADGAPAGLVVFRFRRRLNVATWEGWLSDLFVDPAHRRRGIGRALLQAVVAEWRLRQGHRILLEVDHGNDAALALYRGAGFTEFGPHFQLRPIPPPAGTAPPPGVTLRPWTADDAEAVTYLIAEFGPRRTPPADRLEAVHRTFRAIVATPGIAGWLAIADGSPAGVVAVERRTPFFLAEPVAWISDLVVNEPMRRRGIGAALLDAAQDAATGWGATTAVLESGSQREAAHRLYERRGFVEIGQTLMLRRE